MEENIQRSANDLPKTIFEEAVLHYAGGNSKSATRLILGAILESTKNKNSKTLDDKEYKKNWILALDMFQATKNKENFDKFALFYSNFFNLTPPVFDNNFLTSKNNRENVGRSNLNIDIKISEISQSKIEDFENSTIINKTGLINFSRSSIDVNDEGTLEKLYLLRNTMRNIRLHNVHCIIMGENDFTRNVENILNEIEVSHAGKTNEILKINQVYWLFLCEMYQWLGLKDKFEKLSLSYSKIFNITPPAFDELHVMEQSDKHSDNNFYNYNKDTNTLFFYNELTDLDNDRVITTIETYVDKLKMNNSSFNTLYIDLNDVIRIDYMLATKIAVCLNNEFENNDFFSRVENKKNIVIKNPFEFIVRLFDITGVSNYVSYSERNRNVIFKK